MYDLGTPLLILILLALLYINERKKGNNIFDTSFWGQKESPADFIAERLENNSISNYNISWKENQS